MIDEFKRDLEDNKRNNDDRAERFKLKNGDNKIVILTNPVGFSQVFGIGIAYEDCGYAQYAGRKYKCYVLDLTDNKIKMADFSYTTAKKLAALAEGARTKFTDFPMPYAINLKTSKAGTKEVETDVLADNDYIVPEPILSELAGFSPVREVLDNLKKWQKKQVEENPDVKQKIKDFLAKKEQEAIARKENQKIENQKEKIAYSEPEIDVIEYPEEDNDVAF